MSENLADKIRKATVYRGFRSIRAASQASGINYGTINNWVSGRSIPTVDLLAIFAKTIGVDLGYFAGDITLEQACEAFESRNELYALGNPHLVKLPYWDVPADPSKGRFADSDDPDGYVLFPKQLNADFVVHIVGNCMEPRVCFDDYVGIKRQPFCGTGEVALIEVLETGERMIKRSVMNRGRRYFAPDNPESGYPDFPAEGCRVLGVACGLTRGKGGL